jgi:hypothetical protein
MLLLVVAATNTKLSYNNFLNSILDEDFVRPHLLVFSVLDTCIVIVVKNK